MEFKVCPYCGRPQYQQQPYGPPSTQPYQHPQQYEQVGGIKYVLYLLSFLSLVIGFIIFLVWMNDQNPDKRQIGKNCLLISVVAIILAVLCAVIYFIFIVSLWNSHGWFGLM